MYLTALENIWRYLHDDKRVVDEYLFVTDPYLYTSNFVDMLVKNPDVLPLLKTKMKEERRNSLFTSLMGGYGASEYRIIKMARIIAFHDFIVDEFSELFIVKENSIKLTRIPNNMIK